MVGFGKSFRGTPLRELHTPDSFGWIYAAMKRVVHEPACYRSIGPLFKADGQMIEGERVVLPLGNDETGADGMLGASHYDASFNSAADQIVLLEGNTQWLAL